MAEYKQRDAGHLKSTGLIMRNACSISQVSTVFNRITSRRRPFLVAASRRKSSLFISLFQKFRRRHNF